MTTERSLQAFLFQNKCDEGRIPTHTRIGDKSLNVYGGKYFISNEDYTRFIKLYHQHVFINGKKEFLTEKHVNNQTNITIDLDFRYKPEIDTRQHTPEDIQEFCILVQNAIQTISRGNRVPEYQLFVMEKPNVNTSDDKLTKDGIHIIASLRANKEEKEAIRAIILKELHEKQALEKLPLTNSFEDVLDEPVLIGKTNWQMFGSQKPGNPSYSITQVLEVEGDDLISTDIPAITPKLIEVISVQNETNPTLSSDKDVLAKYVQKKDEKRQKETKSDAGKIPDDLEAICDIINVSEYIDNMLTARKICCALRTVDAKDIAYKLFKKSKHVRDNYDDWFENFWNTNQSKKISLASVYHFAKQSNLELFYAIKHNNNIDLDKFFRSLEGEAQDKDYAELAIDIFGEEFLSINNGKDLTLYYYNGNYWQLDKKHAMLQRKMTIDLHLYFKEIRKQTEIKLRSVIDNEEEHRKWLFRHSNIGKMCEKIKKMKQLKSACEMFNVLKAIPDNFTWEKQIHQFVFQNGIYDMEHQNWIKGSPEDMMRLNCGYDWVEPTEQQKLKIKEFMRSIHPIPAEHDFYCIALASALCSRSQEQFIIANGSGANGKGGLHGVIASMLGQGNQNYYYRIPMSVLAGKEIKTGANPEVANMSYKRMVMASEINQGTQKLNAGIIKDITSGDNEINARDLYSSDTSCKLRASCFMECNDRPEWSSKLGGGEERRLIDYLFRSKFSNKETPNPEHFLFPADNSIKDLQFKEEHRCALFWYLQPYYKKWLDNGMDVHSFATPFIKSRTAKYIENRNPFMAWFNENYTKTDNEDDIIMLKDLHADFMCQKALDLTKTQQKEFRLLKAFKETIGDSRLMLLHYKDRKYINGKPYRQVITNYVKNVPEYSDEEDDIE